jgi:hypothetical protein
MKLHNTLLLLPAALISVAPVAAIQIDWGSQVDSVIRDSFGNPLDETFTVQLGFFIDTLGVPFVPTYMNVEDWSSHWRVFDQAAFDPSIGYFSSSAILQGDGSSSSPYADVGVSFSNQDAYIWINNSEMPVEGSEWFLARSETASLTTDAWNMPDAIPGCCDDRNPLIWSVSDLDTGDTPAYGRQGEIIGAGEYAVTDSYTLQTFTFVPEPSAALLVALGGAVCVLRRRRTWS